MSCVVCGNEKYQGLLNLDCGGFDHSPLYEIASVVSCSRCGHIYNLLTPSQIEGLSKYYNEEYSQCNIGSPNKTGDIPGNIGSDSINRYISLLSVIEKDIKKETSKILDVGCAMGGFLWFIKSFAKRENLYGIEPSERFVEIARRKCDNIVQASAEKIPFDDDIFDIVVADQVVEHLADPNRFFREAKRVIRKMGILCISVPDASRYAGNSFFDFYFFLMREHIQHFGPEQLRAIANKHGFTLVTHKETLPNLISDAGKLPNLTMKFVKDGGTPNWLDEVSLSGPDLYLEVNDYMKESYESLLKRRAYIASLLDLGHISIYGMSREFNYLWRNAGLNRCHIFGLFDDTPKKQEMTIDHRMILSSEALVQAPCSNVLITSYAHLNIMNKNLRNLGFKGNILNGE